MIVPVLLVLAVVFLVLGFAHVLGLLLAIGLAVACLIGCLFFGGLAPARGWRRW
jgi:hypothetical protein